MRRILAVLAVLVGLGPAGAALAAEDLSIAAFYGRWQGTGEARRPDDIFGLTARDLDVTIRPIEGGFKVSWTTVIHPDGVTGSAEVKRKSTAIDFVASGAPGVFRAPAQADPFGGGLMWARIKEQTLTVYALVVDSEGAYNIQSYDRTLTGLGMELVFTRIKDDEPQRIVKGRLIRVSD